MAMSDLRCIIGDEEVHAGFQDPGTILLLVTAGVLVVPGSSRDRPIRGLSVTLRGVEGESSFDNIHVSWLDKQMPTQTPIRVSVEFASTQATPAQRQQFKLPEADERRLRKVFDWLDRPFFKKLFSAFSPTPKPGKPIVLERCSHCLVIRKNEQQIATIGTPWSSMARITLDVLKSGESSCVLELIGYDGQESLSWGSYPLFDGDSIALDFLGNAVPDPVRVALRDRSEALAMIPLIAVFGFIRLFGRRKDRDP